jgi:hypothetical protein
MSCLILGVKIPLKEVRNLIKKLYPDYGKVYLKEMEKAGAIHEIFEVKNGSHSMIYSIGGLDVILLYNSDSDFYGVIIGSVIDINKVHRGPQEKYDASVICDDVEDLHLQTSVNLTDIGIDSEKLKLYMAKGYFSS